MMADGFGYRKTAIGPIPNDWKMSTVGNEFTIQLGKMLDAGRNVGVAKPYIGNRAVQWGRIDTSDLQTVPMSRKDIEMYRLQKGDLLVCEGGDVGRAAIWNAPFEDCYFQKSLHRLRPIRAFDSRLMVAILQRWSDQGLLANYVTQTSIAHLPREKFLELPIPLAPVAEQRAIAEALTDVDALLDGLDRLITKKRDLKLAAMQQLLTGRTRLPGYVDGWAETTLDQIGTFLKGTGVRKDEAQTGNLACVRYGEIYTHHNDYIKAFNSWISAEVAATATKLKYGDLLFAGSGETISAIGKCVTFVDECEAYAGGDIVILRTSNTDPMFMGYYCNTVHINAQKSSKGQGNAVVHISATALASVVVTLPSIEEQTAIAAVLSDMDTELAALESRRDKTIALKQSMMQELLTGRTRLI